MDFFTEFDGNLLIGIQKYLNADWLTPIMKFITLFGEAGIFWIAVCLLLIIFKRTRRLGIICSLALVFTFICCNVILKPTIDRTRPWLVFAEVIRYLAPPGDASFPSGHSANSMGPAWALFIASRPVRTGSGKSYELTPCLGWKGEGVYAGTVHKFAVAAIVLALLIGLSRLYLGMHYPSDVVAGLLLGMLCASMAFQMFRAYEIGTGTIVGSGAGKEKLQNKTEENEK